MSVRINVDIPAGEVEVVRDLQLTIADSGTKNLAETLVGAANAVLRSYGLPASITATTPRQRLIEESPLTQGIPAKRAGW